MASRVASSEAGTTALTYSALWGASADEEDKPRGGCTPRVARRVAVALLQRTTGHDGSSYLWRP